MPSVTYEIPADKFDQFKEAFFLAQPVPTDELGDPLMTENEWIKEWGLRQFKAMYRAGRKQVAIRANPATYDEDSIA